jgi:hypothetical protein
MGLLLYLLVIVTYSLEVSSLYSYNHAWHVPEHGQLLCVAFGAAAAAAAAGWETGSCICRCQQGGWVWAMGVLLYLLCQIKPYHHLFYQRRPASSSWLCLTFTAMCCVARCALVPHLPDPFQFNNLAATIMVSSHHLYYLLVLPDLPLFNTHPHYNACRTPPSPTTWQPPS